MIAHGVGVTPVAVYELKRVGSDFFAARISSIRERRHRSVAMPTGKRLSSSLSVIRPHQQVRRIQRRIHATSVVRPDSGFNLHRIQDPLGDLSIGDGSERRKKDEFSGLHR